MTQITNRDRAEWARDTLAAYKSGEGPLDAENLEERAADFVSDLLHLLRREGVLPTSFDRHIWLQDRAKVNEIEIEEDEEGDTDD